MTEEYIVRVLENDDCITMGELIRCRDCKYYEAGQNEVDAWSACYAHIGRIIETWDDNFCGWAERVPHD